MTTFRTWNSFCASMGIFIVFFVMRFTLYSVSTGVNFGTFVDNSTLHFPVVVKAGAYLKLLTTNFTVVHRFIMSFYMCIKPVPGVRNFSTFWTHVRVTHMFVQMPPITGFFVRSDPHTINKLKELIH